MAASQAVQLFIFPHTIHVQPLDENGLLQAATIISTSIQGLKPKFDFVVDLALLEQCNMRYSEKQVNRIDENFQNYSAGTRFKVNTPFIKPPHSLRYLIRKFFSGDVSGDIGESLFSYFLINVMGLESLNLGHTRIAKRRGALTPDFIINDEKFCMFPLLQNNTNPLLAEVKSFTGAVDPQRISHGLAQLKMGLANSSLTGLLCLVVRNESRQGYDTYLVEVVN
jgi:hypothetical protein